MLLRKYGSGHGQQKSLQTHYWAQWFVTQDLTWERYIAFFIYYNMKKQTGSFIIGIGIASILAGIYGGVSSGELLDALSGVLIGVVLIGTVLIQRNKKDNTP
jgi:hypothetical protein